jgi:uncharacterized protein YbjT (DUF2867 family)
VQHTGEGTQRKPTTVLVLGGAGFIGRHAVAALIAAGATVIVGSRHPQRIDHRLPASAAACARRMVRFEEHTESSNWHEAIADVDVVLNCVGILRQRGRATYQRVHFLAPMALVDACRDHGRRLVHVSALGLDPEAQSRFLTSKLAGEQAIRASTADWAIARPSLLDGRGGFGAWWLRAVARLPIFAVPADARGRIAALDVAELGEALTRLCLASAKELRLHESREFDLGGPEEMSLTEYMRALRRTYTPRAALCIPVPGVLARLVAHVCDLLHATPFSFGHWELLRHDNVPRRNRLAELLGRAPRRVGAALEQRT